MATPAASASFAENAAFIAIAIVSALIGVFKYLKTEATTSKPGSPADTGTVVAASFIDSRLLKELIDALREHAEEFARENKKTNRAQQDVREAVQESTEAILAQTDATINMLRFIKGRQTPDV